MSHLDNASPMPDTQIVAAIDWITCTANWKNKGALEWYKKFLDYRDSVMTDETVSTDFRNFGFEGNTFAKITIADSKTHGLVMVTGEASMRAYMRNHADMVKYTRLDVQITYKPKGDINRLIEELAEQYQKRVDDYKNGVSTEYFPFSSGELIKAVDGSRTLYIGSKDSETQIRVYNKEMQSKDPEYAGCIRFEMQLKDAKATNLAKALHKIYRESGYDENELAKAIRNTVTEQCRTRGLIMAPIGDDDGVRVSGERKASDIATKLKWLETQVSHPVIKLIRMGHINKVIEALGISEYVEIKDDSED